MGTICLSPAPNLRCVGLSLTEELVTLVPVALEVVFSLGLALAGRDAGRCVCRPSADLSDVLSVSSFSIRFLLVAESPIYLLLTVLSLLNRVAPLFQTSLLAHKILDILIGAHAIRLFLAPDLTLWYYKQALHPLYPYSSSRSISTSSRGANSSPTFLSASIFSRTPLPC